MKFDVLQKEMIAAMKARDKARKDSISALVSAAKKLAIDGGCREDIPEEMVDQAIMKEMKSVKEQIDTCPADRTELLEEYKARLAVYEEFAPKMLSEEEVKAIRTRRKNGEKRQEVYKDYSHKCKPKYFESLWYGYNWKNIIV